MKKFGIKSFWEIVGSFCIKKDRLVLLFLFIMSLIFAYGLTKTQVQSDIKTFYRDESRKTLQDIEDKFNEGVIVDIVFESKTDKSVLSPELLHEQYMIMHMINERYNVKTISLAEGLDYGFEKLKKKSLLDVYEYHEIGDALLILSRTEIVRDLAQLSHNLMSNPEIIHRYAEKTLQDEVANIYYGSQKTTRIRETAVAPYVKAIKGYINYSDSSDQKVINQTFQDIREFIQSLHTKDLNVYLFGIPLVAHDIDAHAGQNAFLMAFILLVVNAALLWLLFKSGREIYLTLFILILACVWVFGAAALIGLKLSFAHLIVLPILLGTGVDDNIVLSQRFAEEWGKNSQKSKVKSQKSLIDIKLSEFTDALRTTYKSTGMSVFLTTFTTFAAFTCGALITHVKVLESFYAMVALSMMGVFFLTVLLQGSLRSFLTRRGILIVSSSTPSRHLKLKSSFINFFRRLSTQVFKYQRWILVGLALFFILSCVGASRLESEFSPDLFLRKSMPTYKASYLEEKYFGFNNAGYIVFEGNVAQYELIQKMRELVLKMEKIKNIEKIFDKANVDSILVLIEKKGIIIKESTDVTKAFDEIANSDRTANYILNESYANLSKKYMHKSGDHYDALLMPLYIKGEESKTILGVYHQLQKAIHEIGLDQVPGVTVKISGVGFVHHLEAEYNVKSLLNSFLLSMLVNFLVLILLWRSLRLAVLAMLPLIIAVVLTLGWMWVTGVKLNIFNLSISMIIVGLGIDYPIHLIERYGEDPPKKTIADRIQAAQDMLLTMGPNLFIAALTTIIGFSASMIMTMPVAKSFGIFMSLGIFIVFVVTLVVIPIFLVKVPSPSRRDPFGIDGRG